MKQLHLTLHPGETVIEKGFQKYQKEVAGDCIYFSPTPAHKMQ